MQEGLKGKVITTYPYLVLSFTWCKSLDDHVFPSAMWLTSHHLNKSTLALKTNYNFSQVFTLLALPTTTASFLHVPFPLSPSSRVNDCSAQFCCCYLYLVRSLARSTPWASAAAAAAVGAGASISPPRPTYEVPPWNHSPPRRQQQQQQQQQGGITARYLSSSFLALFSLFLTSWSLSSSVLPADKTKSYIKARWKEVVFLLWWSFFPYKCPR